MATKSFKEAEVKAVGGLSRADRGILHLDEIMDLATKAVPAFREAVINGGSVKEWFDLVKESCRQLREANSETALGFLLRKGVQATALNWYQLAERKWQEYAATESSTGVAEWYAPLYHTTIPSRVNRGGRFPEARVTGENSNLVNNVYGQIVAFDRTLFDDDQTGQIRSYSSRLGDGMAVLESVYASSRFIGASRTYANVTVDASNYTTTDTSGAAVTGPWDSTLYGSTAGQGNRLATYATLNLGRLARAYVSLLNAVDPLGNKIITNPNRLLVSSMDALHGEILIKPGPYPAVIGQSDTTTANAPILGGSTSAAGANQGVTAGFPGGWGSPNPFGGMGWKLVVERYLPDWACALGEAGKGFVNQIRDPLEVIEEAKNSGSYFDFDAIRYRSRERFEMDWIGGGSRFWFLINDGTATGVL